MCPTSPGRGPSGDAPVRGTRRTAPSGPRPPRRPARSRPRAGSPRRRTRDGRGRSSRSAARPGTRSGSRSGSGGTAGAAPTTPGASGPRCASRRRPSCAAARSCPASVRGGELVDLVLADRLDHALLAATQTLHGEHRATLSSHRGAAVLLVPADGLLDLVGERALDPWHQVHEDRPRTSREGQHRVFRQSTNLIGADPGDLVAVLPERGISVPAPVLGDVLVGPLTDE